VPVAEVAEEVEEDDVVEVVDPGDCAEAGMTRAE
jgi:hypothetical protein